MLPKSVTLKFYKRPDIQKAMVQHALDREIAVRYGESFGKRPDMLMYPREIIELAMQGATSFHCSEERWNAPLSLRSDIRKEEMDSLRTGWDLVLDIDCKIMEYSRLAAEVIIRFLRYCGVKDISVKFSGNKGFHIGVPFEAFPPQVGTVLTKNLFPEAPRKIAFYIKENIKQEVGARILAFEKNDFSAVKEKVALEERDIVREERDALGVSVPYLNVEKFLEIDTILLAPRHLYRMPYSLHEKSGLVSLPLKPDTILEFSREMALPENVPAPTAGFLEREVQGESARKLLLQALDFKLSTVEETQPKKVFEEMSITSAITEEFFPPCVQKMLQGMEDGKKRAVFCLMNYLGKIGWSRPDIEELLKTWNKEKNRVSLREVYIKGQLSHFTPGARLPPNCNNDAYYENMGVACHAEHCRIFKNPVNYTLWKWRKRVRENPDEKKAATSARPHTPAPEK